jgi:hypothetical protein
MRMSILMRSLFGNGLLLIWQANAFHRHDIADDGRGRVSIVYSHDRIRVLTTVDTLSELRQRYTSARHNM